MNSSTITIVRAAARPYLQSKAVWVSGMSLLAAAIVGILVRTEVVRQREQMKDLSEEVATLRATKFQLMASQGYQERRERLDELAEKLGMRPAQPQQILRIDEPQAN